MTRYAFIIATDKYSSFSPTPFCHRDAELLAKTLVEACDYASDNVLVDLLKPETPTSPTSILEKLEELVSRSTAGDTILFFYAGHGTTASGEACLVLPQSDLGNMSATALALRAISDVLRAPERICVRIFDACHSGADVRSALDGSGFARAVATTPNQEGWFTFAACGENESSYPDPNRQQGVFTARLCEALMESVAGADVFPERIKIAVCEKVEVWCRTEGKTQTPQFNSAIAGNISFATRKPATQQTPARESGALLSDRLAALKAQMQPWVVGGPEHRAAVEAETAALGKAVVGALKNLDFHGAAVEPMTIKDANALPESYIQRLVRTLLGLGLTCLHDAKEERRIIEQPRPRFASMLYENPAPKVYNDYSLRTGRWPKSVVFVSVASPDGVLPSGMIFFYLAPFQAVSVLLVGYGVTGPSSDPNDANPPLDILSLDNYLKLGRDNTSVIEASATTRINAFRERYEKVTAQRIAYLEEELARLK